MQMYKGLCYPSRNELQHTHFFGGCELLGPGVVDDFGINARIVTPDPDRLGKFSGKCRCIIMVTLTLTALENSRKMQMYHNRELLIVWTGQPFSGS